MTAIPIAIILVGTVLLVIGMLEVGYRVGRRTHRRRPSEKESPVGAFAAAMLGLLAFMLGFTFNIVAQRYQDRKEKVREEVNAIQTAYLRADFLPEPDRTEARTLLVSYVASIAESPVAKETTPAATLQAAFALNNRWHRRLWAIAVTYAHHDLDSNVGALYIDTINNLFAVRAERAMLETTEKVRIPVWIALYCLTSLAVMGVAYQAGIAGSRRSKAGVFLAASFAVVMALIADLDRVGGYLAVSHQPFEELRKTLTMADSGPRSSPAS